MKTRILQLVLLASIVVLWGCFPQRVTWSPDGQRAAVIGGDGLRLCDEAGKLTDVIATGVVMTAWAKDNQRLVVAREADDRHVIEVLTLGRDKVESRRLATAKAKVHDLRVGASDVLAYTDGDPFGRGDKKKPVDLWVVSLAGGEPVMVDTDVAMYPDWTADSRSLVYIRASGQQSRSDQILLGVVNQRRVLDERGAVLVKLPDAQALAGLLMDGMARVRCLSDGRIIFSATEVTLPTTVADAPTSGQLFVLDPQRQATVSRLVPRSQLGAVGKYLNFFSVSPDEKQVVLPDEKGHVSVLTLATGQIERVQGRDDDRDEPRTLPVWRYPDELCYTEPIDVPTGARKAQVALRSAGGQERVLSADWPEGVAKGFLDAKE